MKWYRVYQSVVALLRSDRLKRILKIAVQYVALEELSGEDKPNAEKHSTVAKFLSRYIESHYGFSLAPEVIDFIIKAVVELCTKHKEG
jgi:hypothetical protein